MKRQIKFRAWDGLNMWFEGPNGDYFLTTVDLLQRPDVEIMQLTGLEDERGTDIYEGDIIRNTVSVYKRRNRGSSVELVKTGERCMYAAVRWNSHWGCWDILPDGEHVRERIRVVGNIYENPELLTN